MIKNSQNQTGSAHVVVVVILVAAVIGLLGFVFWQNFISKDVANTDTSIVAPNEIKEVEADKYKDWGTYESTRDGYSIKYPEGWIVIKETNSESDKDGPYFRNFDPIPRMTEKGYPSDYIALRVLLEQNTTDFKAMTGYTTAQWYNNLGKVSVSTGPISYAPEDVKTTSVGELPAKSAKSVFSETNEVIYFLKGDALYSINLYPYAISSDTTVKLMIDSFKFN